MERISGIYKITNLATNKSYIGSAVDTNYRRQSHFSNLKCNKHCNIHLQRAYDKYGLENFKFEIIELCPVEKLIEREQYYFDTLFFAQEYIRGEDTRFNHMSYNIEPSAGNSLGRKATQETKDKMSKLFKGRKIHPNTLAALERRRVNPKQTQEFIDRMKFYNRSQIYNLKHPEKSIYLREFYPKKGRVDTYKKVYQYTLEGYFVKEWRNTQAAGENFNVSYKSIWNNCIGKTNSCKGFRFSYELQNKLQYLPAIPKGGGGKMIEQLTLQGERVAIHVTIMDAARVMGFTRGVNITKCAKGERKQAGGFMWKYYEIDN